MPQPAPVRSLPGMKPTHNWSSAWEGSATPPGVKIFDAGLKQAGVFYLLGNNL
jgi:hypothetical protein